MLEVLILYAAAMGAVSCDAITYPPVVVTLPVSVEVAVATVEVSVDIRCTRLSQKVWPIRQATRDVLRARLVRNTIKRAVVVVQKVTPPYKRMVNRRVCRRQLE